VYPAVRPQLTLRARCAFVLACWHAPPRGPASGGAGSAGGRAVAEQLLFEALLVQSECSPPVPGLPPLLCGQGERCLLRFGEVRAPRPSPCLPRENYTVRTVSRRFAEREAHNLPEYGRLTT
jgi:hypothetical protein